MSDDLTFLDAGVVHVRGNGSTRFPVIDRSKAPAGRYAVVAVRLDDDPAEPLNALGDQMLADSARWFPDLHTDRSTQVVHFALGLAGEVGELVNLVKKWNRGDPVDLREAIGHEVADVLTYLLDLARSLEIDVDAAVAEKRAICESRWGKKVPR